VIGLSEQINGVSCRSFEDAIEIRLRAERRLGEMMAEQPKAHGRAALHDEMLLRITILESVMAELGHALPPITEQDFLDIKKAIALLKARPVGRISVTDFVEAIGAKSILEKIASKLEGNKQALPY
jgi:hypothetical protein